MSEKTLQKLRSRLLDLTARNRLINFRHIKGGSLRIIDELPNQLVETLLSGTEMRFLAVPEPKRDELIADGYIKIDKNTGREIQISKHPSAEEWARRIGLYTNYEVPVHSAEEAESGKHADDAIQTLLYPFEMEARLKKLLQTSNTAIQEMGANILYISFGFLKWFENNNDKPRLAPLFLMPVNLLKGRLNQQTKTYEYALKHSGEDIIPNLSLIEKLRADFSMALPGLDENTKPEIYFEKVRNVIKKNQPRWRLCRYISLALLNFSKLLMYLDLDPEQWPEGAGPLNHPVAGKFLAGYSSEEEEEGSNGGYGFGEEYLIDELENIHEKYPLIDDADSSQHSTLKDAIDGKNLVIEGPPGTGKSQTITNLIAAAMAQGKKALFVAEKLAALEVVRRRLDGAGLGEFCLELHSHKSQKRKLLDEIEFRLKRHGRYSEPGALDVEINRYEELKETLKDHAERINELWKNTGLTSHEILTAAVRYRETVGVNNELIHPEGFDGNSFDKSRQRRAKDQIEAFQKVYQAVVNQLEDDLKLDQHPWYGVNNPDLQTLDSDKLTGLLEGWQNSLEQLNQKILSLSGELSYKNSNALDSVRETSLFQESLDSIPDLKGDEMLDVLPTLKGDQLKEANRYLELFKKIQDLFSKLANKLGSNVLGDLSEIENFKIGSKKLEQLVEKKASLGELHKAVKQLQEINKAIEGLESPLKDFHEAAGAEVARRLQITRDGLAEFSRFLSLAGELDQSYWKLRDDIFDNEELDGLLPKLEKELGQLKVLHDVLHKVYEIESLPGSEELKDLKTTLNEGGFFKWFKSTWRNARKRVISLGKGNQIKFKALEPLLDRLIDFVVKKGELEKNESYKEVLGDHMKGLDTDLAAIKNLRDWYRSVRRQYGVGFGSKVVIGSALFNLPGDAARGLRSLSEKGLPSQIDDLVEKLETLKKTFAPFSGLQSSSASLSTKDGAVVRLLNGLYEGIAKCRPLMEDDSISMEELFSRIALLSGLKKNIDAWESIDLDNALFQGRLGLKIGVNVDNSDSLNILQNTLALASYLDENLKNKDIYDFIISQPDINAFKKLAEMSGELKVALEEQDKDKKAFSGFAGLKDLDWMGQSGDQIDGLISKNNLALNNREMLQNWLAYVRIRNQLGDIGLEKIVLASEQGAINISKAAEVFHAGVFNILAREILREQPELDRFSGHSHKALQDQFRKCDEELKILQRKKIAWKIDQVDVPRGNSAGSVKDYTESSLLEHEIRKKTRHIPIRQLIDRAGEALIAFKPCFMMGPMSVAQYLKPGKIKFDLVIIDEASQIKPEDALGAIGRGSQLVVVGDPKQLPPTSFFDRIYKDEDEDSTATEESESILDAATPMFPSKRLRWHYRSRHESLIAFSNYYFYEDDLILFPSPDKETDSSDSYGIKYYRLPKGCFVNRKNSEEARVIAEAVRKHLMRRNHESIGVVAMNAEQRSQIEVSIEMLAKEDFNFQSLLEKDSSKDEPLFIKNLENVQGDERDVIFVSMTYGPQEPGGRVFQRFGPITSDTGWRRLNVLFTRSKKRMRIFSSMDSQDIIDTGRSSRGVKVLRDFLGYCETGILHHTERHSGRGPDSDFEIAVMDVLKNKGFECAAQVGVAGFFIDIAVLDPSNSGRYLMGIECDGATYHSAKSTRDRDRLRQAVLERLGWRIRRIWSTDWFGNPHGELKPIIDDLNSLKTERVAQKQQEAGPEVDEIEEIIAGVEKQGLAANKFISNQSGLKEKLLDFDETIIKKDLPGAPDNERLLRPAMLKAFLEHCPINKSEYLEFIPPYLRKGVSAKEEKFLEGVLEIINANAEESKEAKNQV